ncbi:MAG TPA: YihY/virulence factor BrkB family protein [Gaiellaceae bacterium]|nr:YihY/virulence factor BrkB family protein [Gaiellaceae bacterium]
MAADEQLPEGATPPQPERYEPILRDPGLRDLSGADWKAVVVRGAKEAIADTVTDIAAALAYYTFLSIPAALLVAVGVFSRTAGPGTVESMMERLEGVVPAEAIALLQENLTRVTENRSGGLVMIVVGGALALWTVTGAINALMRGLNRVYDREETRNFLRQRLTALGILVCLLLAFGLSFGLLVLGPVLSDWVGGLLGLETAMSWIWWIAQWPVLVLGLLLAFAGILYLGPNVDHPKFRFLTPGAVVGVAIWLLASGLFAIYVSMFASYNKAWGSLAAVIIMLTWLWLSGLALLLGAEINAEAERSRELREGKPAEVELQAGARA